MVELLRPGARPVVRIRRDEEAHTDAAPRRALDSPDHAAVGHVRVDDVERFGRVVEDVRDRIGDRPVAAGSVVQDAGRHRLGPVLQGGKECVELSPVDLAAEPAKTRQEDELELRHHRAFDTDKDVVEAAVLEVVLDACAPDPADMTVHDHELAMVDVPEPAQVPVGLAAVRQQSGRHARLGRAHDADFDPRGREAVVERLRAPLRVGALPVDDEPDGNALRDLGNQCVRELVADHTRPEPELIDVHGRRGARDVLEHSRIERSALDEDLHGRGRALVEPEHERMAARRADENPFGLRVDAVVRDESRSRPHGGQTVDCRRAG